MEFLADANSTFFASDIIPLDQKWLLLVVACNLENNNPKLKNNTKITIDSKQFNIGGLVSYGYEGELKLGRDAKISEADIKFDESDHKISRTQFALKLKDNFLHIKCLIKVLSGKVPTLIRITQTEFYLEKENVI